MVIGELLGVMPADFILRVFTRAASLLSSVFGQINQLLPTFPPYFQEVLFLE